jgi:N-acetylmuramoyl-L-alanine amidase
LDLGLEMMGRGMSQRRFGDRLRATLAAVAAGGLAAWIAAAPVRAGEVVVAIDAGHGGIDPGAISGRLVEKDVALGFAHRLARRLEASGGLIPVLVRSDDRFLTLDGRIDLARARGAHVLISIHADTTRGGDAEGAHVYTLSAEGSDAAANDVARRENRAGIIGGIALAGEPDDVALLLVEMAQRGSGNESAKLAQAVLAEMDGAVTLLQTAPHRQANFGILRAPDLPSILVELGYMSNSSDRERLVSTDWQDRMAEALARGIRGWIATASAGFVGPK